MSRKVIELNGKFHPSGGRFLVVNYPKDKEFRRLKLSAQICRKLAAHIKKLELGPNDLLFARRNQAACDPGSQGPRSGGAVGQGRHALRPPVRVWLSISGYSGGKCRCPHCRRAYADYRADRRAAGKDRPMVKSPRGPRIIGADEEHFPRSWFRRAVWQPACKAAQNSASAHGSTICVMRTPPGQFPRRRRPAGGQGAARSSGAMSSAHLGAGLGLVASAASGPASEPEPATYRSRWRARS